MAAGMLLGRRASFLLPLSLVGCRKTASPTAAAEAFLDAYYVERDHDRALAVTIGSAEGRVRFVRDGTVIFDWQDPEPLRSGWFGFRTVDSRLEISDFQVHR